MVSQNKLRGIFIVVLIASLIATGLIVNQYPEDRNIIKEKSYSISCNTSILNSENNEVGLDCDDNNQEIMYEGIFDKGTDFQIRANVSTAQSVIIPTVSIYAIPDYPYQLGHYQSYKILEFQSLGINSQDESIQRDDYYYFYMLLNNGIAEENSSIPGNIEYEINLELIIVEGFFDKFGMYLGTYYVILLSTGLLYPVLRRRLNAKTETADEMKDRMIAKQLAEKEKLKSSDFHRYGDQRVN